MGSQKNRLIETVLLNVQNKFLNLSMGKNIFTTLFWERSGSAIECLTQDEGASGSSLTGVTALCP